MTDRWISSKRHFCETCQCWLSGHARNIDSHEKSEGHQANQQRLIREMHQRERKRKQDALELSAEISYIEQAARVATGQEKSGGVKQQPVRKLSGRPLATGIIGPALKPRGNDLGLQQKTRRIEKAGQTVAAPVIIEKPVIPDAASGRTPLPGSTSAPLRAIWMMSVNPATNQPYYFNTITGETRDTDPSGDVVTPGGIYGARGMTGREIHDQLADAAIAELLPSVNDMAEQYKKYLLRDAPPPPNSIAPINDVATTPSSFSPAIIQAAGKRIEISLAAKRQPFLTLTLPVSLPASKVVESAASSTSQQLLVAKTTVGEASSIQSVKDIILQGSTPEAISSEQEQEQQQTIGQWEEVSSEEKKFGDYNEHVMDEAVTDAASCSDVNTDDVQQGSRSLPVPGGENPLGTSELLAALKDEADAHEFLNDDDLRRSIKKEYVLKSEDKTKCGGLFKKRILKPVMTKKR